MGDDPVNANIAPALPVGGVETASTRSMTVSMGGAPPGK